MKKVILACILLAAALSLPACTEDTAPVTDEPGTSAVQSGGENEGVIGDCRIKIVSAEKGEDYAGEPVVIVTYEWSNNSEDSKTFATSFSAKVYQNGVECSSYTVVDGVDSSKLLAERKPGATLQVQEAYSISDESDVTVEVGPWISFDDEAVVTKTFSLS